MEQTLEGALVPVSKDQLGQEPMKSFMLRAQHQLRAYIALVNAWPRKQGNSIEKREAPQEVIEQTLHMYPMYQTKEFLAVFNKVWGDLNVRDVMIKQVSGCRTSDELCRSTTNCELGVQGGCSAPAGSEAEGEEGRREGLLDVLPSPGPKRPLLGERVSRDGIPTHQGGPHQVRQGERLVPPRQCANAGS